MYLNTKKTKNFKVDIGEFFVDNKRNMVIINKEYRKRKQSGSDSTINDKYYQYHCNKCGYEGWVLESNLLKKNTGCSCCCPTPRVSVLGINTIWDTDRWMCDLGVSEEDAKTHTAKSNKKINVICPCCKKKIVISCNTIKTRKSIGCICSDHISYPEKFMISLLKQLEINFIKELSKTTFDWCGKYRYDFYIPKYNMIIETHGGQHYEGCTSFKIPLKEVQKNDKCKKELALSNKINNYIELDCRHSDIDYIKNSILNSELKELFDLSQVDWLK